MNAAVNLLRRAGRANVRIEARIPEDHPSSQILGTARIGSGTVIDPAGLILTVNYVVLGARSVKVALHDGNDLEGRTVAMDLTSGVALVRVSADDLPTLPLAASRELEIGDPIFVVASVGDGGCRVADGAVTSLAPFDANWEYTLDRAILSTALNPGLGGGALVDRTGRAVGIVSLSLNAIGKFTLAIPAECYLDYEGELLQHGRRSTLPSRAWLGVFCATMRDHVVIAGLLPGAPADRAGLKAGDVILSIDGHDVATRRMLYEQIWTHQAGDSVTLKVYRDNEVRTVEVPTADADDFFS